MEISKNILVTGGAGFIGSSVTDQLLATGHKVVCVDNFDGFYSRKIKEENLAGARSNPNFIFYESDIRNFDDLDSIFGKHEFGLVIHLAAKAGVRPSIADPNAYAQTNVNGTLNVLNAMVKHKVDKLVFASSSSVYGNNEKIPYAETDNVDFPISPYAATKKSCELLNFTYHHLFDLDIINLRFFTVYGPRQRPDLAIYKFFNCLYSDAPIDLYGDGTTSRDYTYITDIVQGMLNAMNYVTANKGVYEIINLGNNNPVVLSRLIEMIETVAGKKFQINRLPMQQGDVERTYADIGKAGRLLNYAPQTAITQGLTNFRDWFQEHRMLAVK